MSDRAPSHARQLVGSLLVAALIVVVVVLAVTLRLGPTSIAELEAREERQEEVLDAREEAREAREEAREERRD